MSTQYDDFMEVVKDNPIVSDFLNEQYFEGGYSFSGKGAPSPYSHHGPWETFSVGVFQWQQTVDRIGLKKGKTLIRVTGNTDNPTAVYEMAMGLCVRLQNGERLAFKSISAARLKMAV